MIRALPASLRVPLERIEEAIAKWPTEVSIDRALKWILQFDSEDYLLAARILENLDVISPSDVRNALEVAHVKLIRRAAEKGSQIRRDNTLYAGIGNAAKSGAMIAYQYRVAAELPEDDFFFRDDEESLDLRDVENIVLVDDVIGTGRTVASEVTRIAEEVYTLERNRNLFVLTVAGYEDGIQHVVKETGACVICALEYSVRDTVSSLDATFFDSLPVIERSLMLDKIKRYCRAISRSDLGYGNVGGLLVFDHNTPNTTLPIVWHRGKSWMPLFSRSVRIPGATKVLKSAQDERTQQDAPRQVEAPVATAETTELTLFVEGRTDEIFVDYFRMRLDLARQIGVKDVVAVALGGLSQSDRMIELLRMTKKHAVFIVDGDEHSRRIVEARNLTNIPLLFLKPSFVAMLDVEKIAQTTDRFPKLPDREACPTEEHWLREVERSLLRRGRPNAELIGRLIEEFLVAEKYDAFVRSLKTQIDRLFGPPVPTTVAGQ